MPTTPRTPAPRALRQLLNLPSIDMPRCDVARMNLLCAIGLPGAEELDVERVLKQLDDWAAAIGPIIENHRYQFDQHPEEFHHSEPYWRMATLTTILQLQIGIRYNPKYLPYSDPNDPAQRQSPPNAWPFFRHNSAHNHC